MKSRKTAFTANKEWLLFLGIFTIGVFLRIYKFAVIPFGLNHDAAFYGLLAIDLGQKLPHYLPHAMGWSGETLFSYWILLNFHLFGISAASLKFTSVIIGTLTLPAFYFLAKKLQASTAAAFSLFFLAISGWHITMSKAGWSVILVPLFQSITIFFLLKALESNRRILWVLSGILLAITLNSYASARITPLIVMLAVLLWLITKKTTLKKIWLNLFYFATALLIFMLPLLSFIMSNWDIYTSRMQSLIVTNRIQDERSLRPLYENFNISLGMLHNRANGDDFFVEKPLLEPIPGILFTLGLISIIITINKFSSRIIAFWLLSGFLPGMLSVPNGNHNFSILVPVYLIIGQGATAIFSLLQKHKPKLVPTGTILIFAVCVYAFFSTYKSYLSPVRQEIFGFYPETTIIGQFMNTKKNSYDFYITDNYPRDALTFITYRNGDPLKKHYTWLENGNDFLNIEKHEERGLIFVMFKNTENDILSQKLMEKFPSAKKYLLQYQDANINRPAGLVVEIAP